MVPLSSERTSDTNRRAWLARKQGNMVAILKAATETSTATSATSSGMSLTVDKKAFKSVLAVFNRVADRRSTLPVLANVAIRVGREHTEIFARDLNLWAMYKA